MEEPEKENILDYLSYSGVKFKLFIQDVCKQYVQNLNDMSTISFMFEGYLHGLIFFLHIQAQHVFYV